MFSSSSSPGSRRPSANAYHDISATTSLDGASPHKLVSLLYSALATQVATARGALSRHDIPAKARAISHATRIVDEGLRMPLDMVQGGAIAANLADLYEYLIHRLMLANLRSDDDALAECARLVEVLREGWDGIGAEVDAPAQAAA